MKKVCCFCECWESGGIESFLSNVLSHMDRSELEVDIVASCLKESVFTAGLEEKGVRFVELSGAQRKLLQNGRMFRQLLNERNYDVVHFNLFQGLSLRFVRLAKQAGVPVRIAHSHNTALRKSPTRWVKLLLHRLGSVLFTQYATDLWACSAEAARFLFPPREREKKGWRFIPNGIETGRFAFDPAARETVRDELGLTDAFVVGSIGRLCYQKNQDFLLDAFAELSALRPDSRLLMAGEGELGVQLKEKAARLGIAGRVIFYGVTDRPERLYSAMDVFAFPSLFEGLGIVAVEAQASGLSVVCSEHVPGETRVTPLAKAVPLTRGARAWAQALADAGCLNRQTGDKAVREAGFDIEDVARSIGERYSGRV